MKKTYEMPAIEVVALQAKQQVLVKMSGFEEDDLDDGSVDFEEPFIWGEIGKGGWGEA